MIGPPPPIELVLIVSVVTLILGVIVGYYFT
jgi:uncharacterized protein YneF (UPF0154 family)